MGSEAAPTHSSAQVSGAEADQHHRLPGETRILDVRMLSAGTGPYQCAAG